MPQIIRSLCLAMCVFAALCFAPASGGEDVQALVDAFLVREAGVIDRVRDVFGARNERWKMIGIEMGFPSEASLPPLVSAARDGNVAEVLRLLDSGADVDVVWEERVNPLFAATKFNRLDVMEVLLERGADPNFDSAFALREAALLKFPRAMKLLLKYGADPNLRGEVGLPPLSLSAVWLWLIPPERILDAMRLLLDAGADPYASGSASPAHHFFIAAEERAIAELLESYGVKIPDEAFEIVANRDLSELHRAARNGDLETVERLVREGADINQTDSSVADRGQTPAYYAAKAGHIEVFSWLAEHGAELKTRSKRPVDDLFLGATLGGNIEVMRICLSYGVPVDYTTGFGVTPLGEALLGSTSGFNEETIALLLENGADPNWRDGDGVSLLHFIAAAHPMTFNISAMEALLRAGADVGALDGDGLSPAHYAAARGNRVALGVLLGKQ